MRVNRYAIMECILFHLYMLAFALTFSRKDEWRVTILLLLLVVVLLFLEYLRTRLFISPLFLWFAFWLGAISIGRMDLGSGVYPLYQVWSERLLRIVLINTEVFFLLYSLGEWRWVRSFGRKKRKAGHPVRGDMLADIVLVLLLLACMAFIVNVFYMGVIPQLTGDANATRETFVATRFYTIVKLLRFTVACVPPAVKSTSSRTKKSALVILTGIFLLEEMLSGWRGYTFQALILLVTSWLLMSDTESFQTRKRNAMIMAAVAVLGVAFIVYITVTRDGSFEAVEVRVKYAIDNFYLYVAPNFLNFQSAVEKVNPKGYLMYSIEGIWGLVIPAWENPLYIWDDMEDGIGAYNDCTYILEPYCDLGTAGTVLWSALIAFFSGRVFTLAREKKTVFSSLAVGICNIVVFFLHNNFFLRSASVIIWLGLGAAVSWVVQKRSFSFYGEKVL